MAEDRISEAETCSSDIGLRFNLHIKCALFGVMNENFKWENLILLYSLNINRLSVLSEIF